MLFQLLHSTKPPEGICSEARTGAQRVYVCVWGGGGKDGCLEGHSLCWSSSSEFLEMTV